MGITGEALEETEAGAKRLLELMKERRREEYQDLPVRLLGLSQGAVFRVAGRYRYKILLKTVRGPRSRQLLGELLENADYLHRARMPEIPGCVLYADPFRLQQVLDNIFSNSYKYAGTDIHPDS